MNIRSLLSRNSLASGAAILATTQLGASVAGFLRVRVLNTTFSGNPGVIDAYLAGFRPSDLLFQTCIVSALGTVLVPVLANYKAHNNEEEMNKVISGTMAIGGLVFGAVALVLGILFPVIAPYLVDFQDERLHLYIQFGRIALLTNFLFVFGNAIGQYLITVQRYWMYGITPILYTVGTIAGTVFLTPIWGAYGPILGTLFGAILYVALRLVAAMRSGYKPYFSLWHPDLTHMGTLMIPRILSLGAFQVQLLFLDKLASGLPKGSLTVNANARDFQSLLVGVVGIAVAQAVYSSISQAAAKKDLTRFRKLFRYGAALCLATTIPGAVILVFLSPLAARLIGQPMVHVFAISLAIYAISIPFESLSHLQLRAFYAMKDTYIPATFGVIGGLAAIVASQLLIGQYGLYAIAIGYTIGEIIQTVGLAAMQPWKTRRVMGDSA
ncbi:MAG: virulence factor [Candidatus Peribacteria bacterium]|nr:virulence factor [Candidatus Peribacteria bacterium]